MLSGKIILSNMVGGGTEIKKMLKISDTAKLTGRAIFEVMISPEQH